MIIKEIKKELLGVELVVRMGLAGRMSNLMVNHLSSVSFLRIPSVRLSQVWRGASHGYGDPSR